MAVGAAPSQQPRTSFTGSYDDRGYAQDTEQGYGWVLFAGTLLLMLGTLNFIEGLAAISNAHFFVGGAHYMTGSLNTWGWVVLFVGIVEWGVGQGVFSKSQFSRWVGVFILGINVIVQLMMIPAYPFWSLSILALDIVAIFWPPRIRKPDLKRSLDARTQRYRAGRHITCRRCVKALTEAPS